MDLAKLGSETAKNGFKNEDDIIEKFNNWQNDVEAQKWLAIMQYDFDEIEEVEAVKLSGYKTDIQVQVRVFLKKVIDIQNLQVKLVSNARGFNQIDKRKIEKYAEMWEMNELVKDILKRYTGEILPNISKPRDKRRMFADEFEDIEQKYLLEWLNAQKALIISDILKGQGQFAAKWMLVAQKISSNVRWILAPMNYCLNFFGKGETYITERGNIKIGKITMQRKRGDGGRETAKMLQFKTNPEELFEE
jgi:hypothetical protein